MGYTNWLWRNPDWFPSTEHNVRRSIFSCLENVGSLEQFICLTKIYVDIISD